eukprot:5413296-Pyramimonas_sp.AAC.1
MVPRRSGVTMPEAIAATVSPPSPAAASWVAVLPSAITSAPIAVVTQSLPFTALMSAATTPSAAVLRRVRRLRLALPVSAPSAKSS